MKARDFTPALYEGHKILPSDIIGGDLAHPYGNTYYVKKSTDADFDAFFSNFNFVTNTGQNTVHTTITLALAAADAGDTIYICPGYYTEEAVLNITQAGLRLLGPGKNGLPMTGLKCTDASHHIVTVNANGVEIAGLAFFASEDGYDGIRIATTVSTYQTYIHDCRFEGYSKGEYGIKFGTGSYDAPDTMIENCLFRGLMTAGIYANGTRAVIRNNLFVLLSATSGIEYAPNAGGRPDGMLLDNRFQTLDGTDAIGIELQATPTAGMILIDGNHFGQKFNGEDHAITKRNAGYLGINYRGNGAITAT